MPVSTLISAHLFDASGLLLSSPLTAHCVVASDPRNFVSLQALIATNLSGVQSAPSQIQRRIQSAKSSLCFPVCSLRRLPLSIMSVLFLFAIAAGLPLAAQDDITTQNATSALQRRIHHRPGLEPVELPERRGLAYYRQPGALRLSRLCPGDLPGRKAAPLDRSAGRGAIPVRGVRQFKLQGEGR